MPVMMMRSLRRDQVPEVDEGFGGVGMGKKNPRVGGIGGGGEVGVRRLLDGPLCYCAQCGFVYSRRSRRGWFMRAVMG